MLKLAIILLIACATTALAQVVAGFTPATYAAVGSFDGPGGNDLRALRVDAWPSLAAPRNVLISGAKVHTTDTSTIDVAAFGIATTLQTTIGFAWFHAESDVPQWNSPDAFNDVQAAAFAWIARGYYIFEWEDANGEDGFQPGQDTVLGGYDLSSLFLEWDISFEDHTVTDNEGNTITIKALVASTRDKVFNIRASASGAPVSVNGIIIASHSLEVEFLINYFDNPNYDSPKLYATGPSDAADHPNSHIGMVFALAAAGASIDLHDGTASSDPNSVVISAGGNAGIFAYSPTASVKVAGVERNGAIVAHISNSGEGFNVSSDFHVGWTLKYGYFSLDEDRPESVYWDPTLTAKFGSTSTAGAATVPLVTILALLCSVLAAWMM